MRECLNTAQLGRENLQDPIEITPAACNDLEQIACLMERIYPETYPNEQGITRVMFEPGSGFAPYIRNYLAEQLSDSAKKLLLAREGSSITGTIGIQETEELHTYEIWGFYIDPNEQGRGVGRVLWDTLMSSEYITSAQKLMLYVAQNSVSAQRFYENNGFKIVGEEKWDWPHWTEDRPHNKYWRMVKELA